MKEAFENIRKRIEEIRTVEQFNRGKMLKENDYTGANIAHRGIVMLNDALSIVFEVEAEYGKKGCALCYLGSPCEYQNEDVRIPDELMGWIPCSERLPEIRQDCLVTVKYSGFLGMHGFWVKTGHMEAENDWCGDCFGGTVIAWMPLPEPYKPEK